MAIRMARLIGQDLEACSGKASFTVCMLGMALITVRLAVYILWMVSLSWLLGITRDESPNRQSRRMRETHHLAAGTSNPRGAFYSPTPVKVQFGVENVARALLPVFDRDGQECPSYGKAAFLDTSHLYRGGFTHPT